MKQIKLVVGGNQLPLGLRAVVWNRYPVAALGVTVIQDDREVGSWSAKDIAELEAYVEGFLGGHASVLALARQATQLAQKNSGMLERALTVAETMEKEIARMRAAPPMPLLLSSEQHKLATELADGIEALLDKMDADGHEPYGLSRDDLLDKVRAFRAADARTPRAAGGR